MSPSNVLAGVFLFLLGAATMAAYAYRKEIRTLLGLSNDQTVNAVGDIVTGVTSLLDKFKPAGAK